MTKLCWLVLLLSVAGAPVWCADAEASARLRRFNDAKFGMFIHWGPYSLASVEASWPILRPKPGQITEAEYRALPSRFNPTSFDPVAWVRLAKAAGQRYMVFTSKHHDGFVMYDSAYTNYKITNTPYQRDIVAQLAAAAKAEGMPLGFYYSPPDMNHAAYRDTSKLSAENMEGEPTRAEWPLYLSYMEMQVRELLTHYGDVFVVWFDGLGHLEKYDGTRYHKVIHDLQPGTLINNRIGPVGDFITPEQRLPKEIPHKADKPGEFQPWETCMTINGTWAYNRNDQRFKSTTDLLRALIDAASKGGNFLLNVGPTPEGTIQPEFEQRLREMGQWLAKNGDAIYGTTYGPWQDLKFGRSTAKGSTVYLHLFEVPKDGIDLPAGVRAKRVRVLASGAAVRFENRPTGLHLDTAGIPADPHATVLAIDGR